MTDNRDKPAKPAPNDESARGVSEERVKAVLDKAGEYRKKARSSTISRYLDDLKMVFMMIRDYFTGRYRKVPWWVIVAVVFAVLYVINPFDMVPDFIPIIGFLDDAAVISLCLAMIGLDLDKYREWREEEDSIIDVTAKDIDSEQKSSDEQKRLP